MQRYNVVQMLTLFLKLKMAEEHVINFAREDLFFCMQGTKAVPTPTYYNCSPKGS